MNCSATFTVFIGCYVVAVRSFVNMFATMLRSMYLDGAASLARSDIARV